MSQQTNKDGMDNMIDYTVDLLIFGISNKENSNIRELSKKNLSVVLVKRDKEPFKDMLVLPGGYVNNDETSEEAAKRILEKETGLKDIDLYLSSVNDDINRDPRNRTVSVSYIALIDVERSNKLKENSKWYDINYRITSDSIDIKLGDNIVSSVGRKIVDSKSNYEKYYSINKNVLGFDHDVILTKGIMDLRNRVKNTDIIFNLFPEKFTIGSLEQVYGDILKEKVVNSAFRRVFAEKLEATDEIVKTGGHRPSVLYKYKKNPVKIVKEEMVDVYNPDTLEKTGISIAKNSAHKLGVWHSAIHLVIINKDKTKTLIQQRASNKAFYPNIWDISVGGHISSGESDKDSVIRELKEELGIDSCNMELIKKHKEELYNNGIDNKEIVSMFVLYMDVDIKDIKLQKEEVQNAKWVTKEEFNLLISNGNLFNHIEETKFINEILK